MKPIRVAALAIAASLTLAPPLQAPATAAAPLSKKTPIFTAGHWLGKGWFTATTGNGSASGVSDGAFTFDLTIGVSGLVVGRMIMSTTGSVTSDAAIATFTETSAGTGWILSGNGASVDWDGMENVSGKMTGRHNGMTIALPIIPQFHAYGHFEPQHATCNTASGNISVPLQKAFAAGPNPNATTVSGPWVAVKVDGGDGLKNPNDQVEGWLETIAQMDAAADDDFKGMSAKQLQTLIAESQQVEAAIRGFQKCGSGAPGLASQSTKNMFDVFAIEIASAKNALEKIGGHF